MTACDVLVVGAGPTGLVLALWLTKLGAKVRIVDKTDGARDDVARARRAGAHARTLPPARSRRRRRRARAQSARDQLLGARRTEVRIAFEDVGVGLTPFPYVQIFPQDEHERLLVARLEADGRFGRARDRARRILRQGRPRGGAASPRRREATRSAKPLSSPVATALTRSSARRWAPDFRAALTSAAFYVADVEASGPTIDGELHVDLDDADFLAVFPLKGEGRARLIGTVRGERVKRAETLRFDDVSDRAIRSLKVKSRRRTGSRPIACIIGSRTISAKDERFCWATRPISTVPRADRE